METMQEFLDSSIECPELAASDALYAFVSMNEGDFCKFKSSYEKLSYSNPNAVLASGNVTRKMFYQKNPIKVENMYSIGGNVESKISPGLKTFAGALKEAVRDYQPMMLKCKESIGQLLNSLMAARSNVDKANQSIAALLTITRKFGDVVEEQGLPRWDLLESIYSNLSKTMFDYGEHLNNSRLITPAASRFNQQDSLHHSQIFEEAVRSAARPGQGSRRRLGVVL